MPYLSGDTTNFSNISLYGGQVFASRVSTPILNIGGGATLSTGSLDLRTSTVVVSLDTRADSSGMTTGELRLVFAASGMSLVYSSGATVYTVGASAVSAAQA